MTTPPLSPPRRPIPGPRTSGHPDLCRRSASIRQIAPPSTDSVRNSTPEHDDEGAIDRARRRARADAFAHCEGSLMGRRPGDRRRCRPRWPHGVPQGLERASGPIGLDELLHFRGGVRERLLELASIECSRGRRIRPFRLRQPDHELLQHRFPHDLGSCGQGPVVQPIPAGPTKPDRQRHEPRQQQTIRTERRHRACRHDDEIGHQTITRRQRRFHGSQIGLGSSQSRPILFNCPPPSSLVPPDSASPGIRPPPAAGRANSRPRAASRRIQVDSGSMPRA